MRVARADGRRGGSVELWKQVGQRLEAKRNRGPNGIVTGPPVGCRGTPTNVLLKPLNGLGCYPGSVLIYFPVLSGIHFG